MTMLPADCAAVTTAPGTPPPSGLEKGSARPVRRHDADDGAAGLRRVGQPRRRRGLAAVVGRVLVSACLWFVYGLQKRDKTIYLACIGWILLDAAIVIGVIVNR